MKTKRMSQGVFAAAVAAVIGFGAIASTAEARRPGGGGGGGGCFCPTYYAPVLCSNGQTYSNICFAGCDGATGCVPTGPGPVPI